jgi:hypothetical protein
MHSASSVPAMTMSTRSVPAMSTGSAPLAKTIPGRRYQRNTCHAQKQKLLHADTLNRAFLRNK